MNSTSEKSKLGILERLILYLRRANKPMHDKIVKGFVKEIVSKYELINIKGRKMQYKNRNICGAFYAHIFR